MKDIFDKWREYEATESKLLQESQTRHPGSPTGVKGFLPPEVGGAVPRTRPQKASTTPDLLSFPVVEPGAPMYPSLEPPEGYPEGPLIPDYLSDEELMGLIQFKTPEGVEDVEIVSHGGYSQFKIPGSDIYAARKEGASGQQWSYFEPGDKGYEGLDILLTYGQDSPEFNAYFDKTQEVIDEPEEIEPSHLVDSSELDPGAAETYQVLDIAKYEGTYYGDNWRDWLDQEQGEEMDFDSGKASKYSALDNTDDVAVWSALRKQLEEEQRLTYDETTGAPMFDGELISDIAERGDDLIAGPYTGAGMSLPTWFVGWQDASKAEPTTELFTGEPRNTFAHLDDREGNSHNMSGPSMRNGFPVQMSGKGPWFYKPGGGIHMAMDISAAVGTQMQAFADMEFVRASGSKFGSGGYITTFRSRDPNNGEWIYWKFMHLRDNHENNPKLKKGDRFLKGESLPVFTGRTGRGSGPHLHLTAERGADTGKNRIDPAQVLCDISNGTSGHCRYIMDSGGDRAGVGKKTPAWHAEEKKRKKRWAKNPNNPANIKPRLKPPTSGPPKTLPSLGAPPGRRDSGTEEGRLSEREEALVRRVLREAIKKKSLTEEEVAPSTRLFQVVLVLNIKKPITDIEGKLNRIRAIGGVTIISHERSEETIYRGDVVAKIKFHPRMESMTAWTYVNQILVPEINSSRHVPDVSVVEAVHGTMKEIT